jgi:hypothetical protein
MVITAAIAVIAPTRANAGSRPIPVLASFSTIVACHSQRMRSIRLPTCVE